MFFNWKGDYSRLTQHIIDDEGEPEISKFACEYRATRQTELTELLVAGRCREVVWKFPEETGFYQPIADGDED